MKFQPITARLSSIGAILVASVFFTTGVYGQDMFTPWKTPNSPGTCTSGNCPTANRVPTSSCPNGNCTTRTWFPTVGPTTAITNSPPRVINSARPTYLPAPTAARQPVSLPVTNRESPYYEYRQTPRTTAPEKFPSAAVKNNDSPFYP